jgi:hypothetical protein
MTAPELVKARPYDLAGYGGCEQYGDNLHAETGQKPEDNYKGDGKMYVEKPEKGKLALLAPKVSKRKVQCKGKEGQDEKDEDSVSTVHPFRITGKSSLCQRPKRRSAPPQAPHGPARPLFIGKNSTNTLTLLHFLIYDILLKHS